MQLTRTIVPHIQQQHYCCAPCCIHTCVQQYWYLCRSGVWSRPRLEKKKKNWQQRDAAVAAAGDSRPPDGVFGSRLPRCGCFAMTQQSYSEKHTNRTKSINTAPAVPICGSGHAAAAALFSCLSFDRCLPRAYSFLFLFRSFKPGDTKPHAVSHKTPHHIQPNVTAGTFEAFFGLHIFLASILETRLRWWLST